MPIVRLGRALSILVGVSLLGFVASASAVQLSANSPSRRAIDHPRKVTTTTTATLPSTTTTAADPTTTTAARAAVPTTTKQAAPVGGGLSIAITGNRFVNQHGQTVVLRGVNTEGTQYDCAQSGAGFYDDTTVSPGDYSTEIEAMKAWGINLVRVNLNEECWLGINGVPASTSQTGYPVPAGDTYDRSVNAYMHEMGQYVAALNASGIYTEIDLHLNAPGSELISDSGSMDAQNPLPESNSDPFWKSVAAYFHNDHAVIFGIFNEPFPPNAQGSGDTATGWACVINGCTVPDYTDEDANQYSSQVPSSTYQGEGMRQMIDDIREYNAAAPLLAGGPDFAGDMDQWLASYEPDGASLDPSHQLAASVHIYYPAGNSPCSDTTNVRTVCGGNVFSVATSVPVVVDEVGDMGCSNSSVFPFLQSVDAADASGSVDIGYAGWSWSTYNCDPNLITSYSTGAPSQAGEAEYCELLDLGAAPQSNPLFSPSDYCTGPVPDATPR